MHVTLAVPDLLAHSRETAAALPSLARLAHYAGPPNVQRGGLDVLLLRDLSGAAATAPLAALGAGLDPGASFVLRADPVSLVAGRNDVALAARIDDLDAGDAAALIATLNAHFGGDGLAFRAPRPDAWFVLADTAPDLTTTPLAAVRGAIYPFLPGGGDGPRWRRWMSEMQMLLHDHPANAAREARGQVSVTGIWIADGGRFVDVAAGAAKTIFAPRGRAGDVARGFARAQGSAARETPAQFAALPASDATIAVLDRAMMADAARFDADWLHPALAALEMGKLASLALLADGGGIAAAWRAQHPTLLQRVRAKIAPHPLAWPLPDLDDA